MPWVCIINESNKLNFMLGCAFSVVVIVISGQSMIVSSRNKPVNTVLQAQIVVSQIKY